MSENVICLAGEVYNVVLAGVFMIGLEVNP